MRQVTPSEHAHSFIGRWPRSKYICKVCGLPGEGARNATVHPGDCRVEWQRRLCHKSWLKRKAAAKAAKAALA